MVGVVARFAWQFLSVANYFGVPVVLLTMSFWDEPNYFPWLRYCYGEKFLWLGVPQQIA